MAVARDNRENRTALEVRSGAVGGTPQGLHENLGTHDPLDRLSVLDITDVEQPISVEIFGRFLDENTRFNSVGHGLPPTLNATRFNAQSCTPDLNTPGCSPVTGEDAATAGTQVVASTHSATA
jgi:hypothetical protein